MQCTPHVPDGFPPLWFVGGPSDLHPGEERRPCILIRCNPAEHSKLFCFYWCRYGLVEQNCSLDLFYFSKAQFFQLPHLRKTGQDQGCWWNSGPFIGVPLAFEPMWAVVALQQPFHWRCSRTPLHSQNVFKPVQALVMTLMATRSEERMKYRKRPFDDASSISYLSFEIAD